jgi:uncharacterized membrane protein YhaH (DUF805 family)
MSIGRGFETPYGDFMMNGISQNPTDFTLSLRQSPRLGLCCPPSTSSCVSPAPCPSGMVFLADILGLPFSHTSVITKGFFSMEITGGSGNVISAIVTLFCKFILWLATLIASLVVAIRRTIDFIETQKGRKDLFAGRANLFNCVMFIFESWHSYNIITNNSLSIVGIEIEQKYCDIAIERLRQGVLPL